ncbi:MAG: ferredoxin [Gammaproteobacteria bacterium CG11_big_fil_rev_8_21_14_0_20_46_22]|nr:MAG: ferredoxin [Gammaproteobacteria bacterium CG12_big_fil_rev_8_21_14_0_65_46_12]PIR10051.1 MAG: ferredoxin [Gammaproteobacteria bacterium CG11_big_fil_rev_8_21_14_0_20_46_22]
MLRITFQDECYENHTDETVLDCLKRHQVDYPCGCQSGICQSCLAQLTDGEMDSSWQKGLKETLLAKNYFLACLAKPKEDISLALPGLDDITRPAQIKKIQYLNKNVICLALLVSETTLWTPGQYLNLINFEGCRRSYSIANVPEEDGYIALHIKLMPNGVMSAWLKNTAHPGCNVCLQGPMGDCFYTNPSKESFPMVLAGTGTGLAPLLAIVRDALRQQHKGQITLIHGGVCAEDLYLDEKLKQLAKQHKQLAYKSCVLNGDGIHQESTIDKVVLNTLKNNPRAKVYVCGPEATTKKLKTTAFLAGVPSALIYSDAFLDNSYAKP